MAQGIDLNNEFGIEAVNLPHVNETVENQLPVLVAREVIVGNEEPVNVLRRIGPDNFINVIGRTVAGFVPLL